MRPIRGNILSQLNQIAAAIVASDVTDEQKRLALPLVEKYIDRFKDDSKKFQVLAVENPWYLWLDADTLIVGVMDANRINLANSQYEELELKTRRAPRFKKDGQPYQGDTEADWQEELINSAQVGIYALARVKATFLTPLPLIDRPIIRVRAAVKSDNKVGKPSPVMIWPTNDDAVYSFDNLFLDNIEQGLKSMAVAIRAKRAANHLPYQLMGYYCRRYGHDCEFLESVCKKRLNNQYEIPKQNFSRTDPGAKAIEAGMQAREDELGGSYPEDMTHIVILSASSYADFAMCSEYGRLKQGGWFEDEDSDALNIGTVFHNGVGEFNRGMMKEGL